MVTLQKRLYRSKNDRMIAGVCGGLGDYFDIDSSLIRLAVLLIFLFQGIGLIAYIIAWIIISEEPVKNQYSAQNKDSFKKNVNPNQADSDFEAENDFNKRESEAEVEAQAQNIAYQEAKNSGSQNKNNRRQLFAMIMILLGSIFLVDIWIPDFYWERYWPLIFIILGFLLLKGDQNDIK